MIRAFRLFTVRHLSLEPSRKCHPAKTYGYGVPHFWLLLPEVGTFSMQRIPLLEVFPDPAINQIQ